MAPLGIITALVSAIRAGGPKWLRALVGRARENVAEAEVELMSSTSQDVCELYNGKAIVRTIGRPMIKQLIYLDWLEGGKECGLFTLEESADCFAEPDLQGPLALLALEATKSVRRIKDYVVSRFSSPEGKKNERDPDPEKGHLGGPRRKESQSPDKSTSRKKRQSVDNSDMDDSPTEAPNISLNLHGWCDVSELALYAFLGIVLQVGVLVFSGFVAYNPRLNGKLGGSNVRVGFPLQAVGTIFLSLSMFLCSLVIDQSTKERRWVVKDRDQVMLSIKNATPPNPRAGSTDGERPTAKSKEMSTTEIATSPNSRASSTNGEKLIRIFWLQKRHVAGDQSFNSYLLMPKQKCDEILTSRRSSSAKADAYNKVVEGVRENYLSTVTIIGILSGILGFVAQFEGFRLSNWSSAIAQLVAVFLMTILRAVVRRGLIEGPVNKELPDQYEIDWLALQLAVRREFLDNFGDPQYQNHPVPLCRITLQRPKQDVLGKGHEAVKIRQRLGKLTKWAGSASKEAITVANSIEIVMNELESSISQGHDFKWRVNVKLDEDRGTESKEEVELAKNIEFTVTCGTYGQSGKKMWRADATEIEAALSLWNYHFYNYSKTVQRESNQRDWLRPAESRLARPCRRVLGHNTDALGQDVAWWIGDGIAQEAKYEPSAEDLWWGFNEMDSENINSVLAVNTPWEGSLAQHLFSAFMSAIAKSVKIDKLGHATVDPRSFNVDDHETWSSPKFENANLLRIAREIEHTGLGTLDQVYLSIIPPLSRTSQLPDEAMVSLVRQRVHEHEVNCRWSKASKAYLKLLEMSKKRSPTDRFVYKAVAATIEFLIQATTEPLAKEPGKPDEDGEYLKEIKSTLVERLKSSTLKAVTDNLKAKYVKQSREKQFDRLLVDNDTHEDTDGYQDTDEYEYENNTDVLGWTRDQYKIFEGSMDADPSTQHSINTTDIAGKTLLHYAAMGGKLYLVNALLQNNANAGAKGRDGMVPLHWAATAGHNRVVKELLEHSPLNDLDNAGRTALHLAAWKGHEGVVELLLAKDGVEPNAADSEGRTALSRAAENGHEGVVGLLLAKDGVEPNATDGEGRTALSRAAENGHEGVVERLLAKDGVELNATDREGRTALSRAAENGHEGVVGLLLAKDGVKPNAMDGERRTALSLAAELGHEGVVRLLLAKDGVEPNAADGVGCTALSRAAERGHEGVVGRLLAKDGVEPNVTDKWGRTALSQAAVNGHEGVVRLLLLAKDGVEPNATDGEGRTVLSQAAENGHEGVVRRLLLAKDGVEPNATDKWGRAALSRAAENGHEGVVGLLLAKDGVEPDATDSEGRTALWRAVENGHEGVVELLLAKDGVELKATDGRGRTALSLAAKNGHEGVVRLLLAKDGVEPNATDGRGRTALLWAAEYRNEGVVRLLLAKDGVEPNATDSKGRTALSRAAENGHEDVVRLLLAKDGVEPNATDKWGRAALSHAAQYGHEGVVRLLLAKDGVELNATDGKGRTALSWAAQYGHEGVMRLLQSHGAL